METSTLLIGGGVIIVGVVAIVMITSSSNQPTTTTAQQQQPTGNAATQIAQGATQGILQYLTSALSDSGSNNRSTEVRNESYGILSDPGRGSNSSRYAGASSYTH